VLLLVDLFVEEPEVARRRSPASAARRARARSSRSRSTSRTGSMFGGGYVVDDFALVLKALFLLAGYVVVLSVDELHREGDYHEGEYYFCCSSSVLGMVMMASSRDLIRSSWPSSCSRSRPTCSRRGASGTSRATRRHEVLPAGRVRVGA
jgi:NADH:ubiquinone oxidoreductase subunit 2 (subunit N)